jgi:hypothetical protein
VKTRSSLVSRRQDLKEKAKEVEAASTGNDTMLAHITPREARLLKSHGGSGLINRRTGLYSFDDGGGPDGGGGAGDGPGSGAGADASGVGGGGGSGVGGDSGSTGGSEGTGNPSSPHGDNEGMGGGPGAPSANNGAGPIGADDGGRDVGPAPHSNPDITAALDNAVAAGIFGGIGSANPEAAANAQAGLSAVGLGSAAAPTSSFG